MEAYQQRVSDEREALEEKRAKLREFMDGPIFKALCREERMLLVTQSHAMAIYSNALYERMLRFGAEWAKGSKT